MKLTLFAAVAMVCTAMPIIKSHPVMDNALTTDSTELPLKRFEGDQSGYASDDDDFTLSQKFNDFTRSQEFDDYDGSGVQDGQLPSEEGFGDQEVDTENEKPVGYMPEFQYTQKEIANQARMAKDGIDPELAAQVGYLQYANPKQSEGRTKQWLANQGEQNNDQIVDVYEKYLNVDSKVDTAQQMAETIEETGKLPPSNAGRVKKIDASFYRFHGRPGYNDRVYKPDRNYLSPFTGRRPTQPVSARRPTLPVKSSMMNPQMARIY